MSSRLRSSAHGLHTFLWEMPHRLGEWKMPFCNSYSIIHSSPLSTIMRTRFTKQKCKLWAKGEKSRPADKPRAAATSTPASTTWRNLGLLRVGRLLHSGKLSSNFENWELMEFTSFPDAWLLNSWEAMHDHSSRFRLTHQSWLNHTGGTVLCMCWWFIAAHGADRQIYQKLSLQKAVKKYFLSCI